jgi:hypothetical protein
LPATGQPDVPAGRSQDASGRRLEIAMTNTWVQLRNNWLLIALALVLLPANYYWWAFLTAESRQAAARPDERAVIGQPAPPVIARDLDGEWRRLDFSATSHAILYVTSPQCGWCTRNIPNVKALAQAAAGDYAFIGLFSGTGDAREYRERHGLTFPLYTAVDDASRDAYKMIGTPQTVVIRNGVVVANWIGAYGGSRQRELEAMFAVSLPGILPDSPAPAAAARVGCLGGDGEFYSVGRRVTLASGVKTCGADGEWSSR